VTLLLGVDTGGTYTDAVLIRNEAEVVASAKALTTRHDLAVGIGHAVEAVLRQSGAAAGQIGLASLSTTLATNALVEGQGGCAGLVYVGFRQADLQTHGLSEALAGDPALVLAGGHNHAGGEAVRLDETRLRDWLEAGTGAEAYAVAALFATRNPAHELRAAEVIRAVTGRPVSLSHHLSAKLNGPKRALTALLNARLIGMITRLIDRAETRLRELGIHAPLMVVRGDGALISADQARDRPIETILSGPAASLVGARWLTGADRALVSDIGGTTTDVAVLRDGRPAIDAEGAKVGPWRTFGLGGDSEVHVTEGLGGGVSLGPRRVVPVSLMAMEAREAVHRALEEQARALTPGEMDARFVRAVPGVEAGGLTERETALLARFGEAVKPLGGVLKSRMDHAALGRLVRRGLVQVGGITPSDAAHVLGKADAWDAEAARMALALVARKRTGSGERLANGAEPLARMIVDRLTHQTSLAVLETAFAEEETDFGLPPADLAAHVLMQRGLGRHRGLVRIESGLNVPVIGLGASAASYYPAVGERLGCEMIVPEYAGVANAIGAVVGRVTIRRAGTVTSPAEGRFRVHLEGGPEDFAGSEAAMAALEATLGAAARQAAVAAGAVDIHVSARREVKEAVVEARRVFLEAEIVVEASGRPRVAG
jgi:N-methylhydantoinase A/oxoprolinase/acetone carboxylase beta subunit